MSSPTLAQLRLFVSVAELGSFSEAAATLQMSQSSLSEAVATLERALGHTLLRRSRVGVTLTPAGARALDHARSAVLAASDVQLAVQEDTHLSATLNIATYRSIGTHLLPGVLAELRRAHPDLQVRIHDAEGDGHGGEHLVRSGRADVALIDLPVGEGLLAWPLLQDEYRLIVPRDRQPGRLSWEDLRGEHLILPPAANSCHFRTRAHLTARHVGVESFSEVAEDAMILRMVEHGVGVSIMPGLAYDPLPPGLQALPLPEPLVRTLGVVVRVGRANLPHVKVFVTMVRAHAARLPSGPELQTHRRR
ncbi:LysR family transcriptional regulator [Deinococcus pimensis]|uniref:LysR family transcriptional regulator n=1 Tax=Deinococcus pimensis TaxID=309888 RepID=UPI000485F143|nr:LysR family transcriptional regulator [Deinococcus pimensis]